MRDWEQGVQGRGLGVGVGRVGGGGLWSLEEEAPRVDVDMVGGGDDY